ncbi:uncharacterized protein [Argopecten irradians]|uniref:uncharacterized protein n=1 Tax=Argopecten irradians TaxID=31199 RepID=UPI0037116EB8
MPKNGRRRKVGPTSTGFDGVMAIRHQSRGLQHHNSITSDLLADFTEQPHCDVSKYCGKRWEGYRQDTQSKFYEDSDSISSCCLPNRNKGNQQNSTEDLIDEFRYEDGYSSDLHKLFMQSDQTKSPDQCARIDLQLADTLIHSGTNVNVADIQGETVLHKAARKWHKDVALFLINHGADVNAADVNGCVPLHVAAANDYTDMVHLLIKHGANIEARTLGDKQTPLFFAARYNCCCDVIDCLINHGSSGRMYRCTNKGRYPIQLAAEQDRSLATRLLLKRGARAWMNRNNVPGYGTIGWMIINMPTVAYEALTAYHTTARTHRSQSFYLYPLMADEKKETFIDLPLQVAVNKHQYNLLSHPVFSTLIGYMWDQYAKQRAILWFLYNMFYVVVWSLIGVLIPYEQKYHYDLPSQSWRIVLHIIGIGLTIWEIIAEILEYRRSITKNDKWKKFRARELYADMKHCIDVFDKQFLQDELHELEKQIPRYFKDFWNVFDWVCYGMQGICMISHLADVISHNEVSARFHIDFMALTLIFLWLRLAKCARPFTKLGPLIVILAKVIEDFLLFVCLYLQFFLPFVCAYWMIFGGEKVTYETRYKDNNTAEYVTVDGYTRFNDVFFSLFRITLVDDYDYQTMKTVDPIMTDILVGSWLTLSAVVCLNLFIALLSDSFQRVYDNAHSIARMQKAIVCLVDWDLLSDSKRKEIINDLKERCNPLLQSYDDDDKDDQTDGNEIEMQRAVIQLREITKIQKQNQEELVERLDHDINKIEKDIYEMKNIVALLYSALQHQGPSNQSGSGGFTPTDIPGLRSTSKKKKKKRKTSSREDMDEWDVTATGKSDQYQPTMSLSFTSQNKVADISSLNMDDDENV